MSSKQNKNFSTHRLYTAILLLLGLGMAGCTAPYGLTRVSPQDSYNLSVENVLGADKISDSTKSVLHRYNLLDMLPEDPVKMIQNLHGIAKSDARRDILFALSELSYLQGEAVHADYSNPDKQQAFDFFLQSAVYAYYYLLDEARKAPPTPYDKDDRVACELYNRSLWQAFPVNKDGSIRFLGDARNLTGGSLSLEIKTDTLSWDYDKFEGFFPSESYELRGFTVRNRTAGLGMPLFGILRESTESPNGGALPITGLLRLPGSFSAYLHGDSRAVLELYSVLDTEEIELNDRMVPLETDITTPLAYRLNDSSLWTIGERRFLSGAEVPLRLLLIQPYEPGRIPVVFVHGTASSPVWWAEMVNSLRADPEIRKQFQFWFYQYNSSNLITLSAAELREAMSERVKQLDPQNQDPALHNMVVIGHSQGGLLTKMTAVNSGSDLWNAIINEGVEEMDIKPEMDKFARRLLFFEALPFVTRVVFISTPHRGSYLTKDWVRSLVRNIIRLPSDIFNADSWNSMSARFKLPQSMKDEIPTSIDGMSADNPLLEALAALPLAPGVTGHSIVAVKPGMDIADGNDGVVAYKSAHIEGVESEFIVRAEHSCQDHPFVIEEVRRILLKHVGINNTLE